MYNFRLYVQLVLMDFVEPLVTLLVLVFMVLELVEFALNAVMMKTARTLQIFAHALLFSAVVDSVIPTRNFINVVSIYIKVITYLSMIMTSVSLSIN